MKLTNLRFKTRLFFGFGIVIVLNLVSIILAIQKINKSHIAVVKIYNHPLAVSNAVRDINANINAIHRTMKDVVLSKNIEQLDKEIKLVNKYDKQIYSAFDIVFERFLGDMQDVQRAFDSYGKWEDIRKEVITLMKDGRINDAIEITRGKGADHVKKLFEHTQIMIDFAKRKADEFYVSNQKDEREAIQLLIIMLVVIFSFSILCAVVISNSISKPIKYLVKRIKKSVSIEGFENDVSNRSEQMVLDYSVGLLEKYAAELKVFNIELEYEVEKRTIELHEKNEEIEAQNEEYKQINEELLVAKEQSEKHEEELRKHKEDLEWIVKDRTEELEASNEELKSINEELYTQRNKLEETLKDLNQAQAKLVQSEKMASLGTLVAGVAHEINNPVNFISSSLSGLKNNLEYLSKYMSYYETINEKNYNDILNQIQDQDASLIELFEMFRKSIEIIEIGVKRTSQIVKSLKSFARADQKELAWYDLHENIENTLLILYNQYKERIEIKKSFGTLPLIECYPGQINQVLMNILINAVQAIKTKGVIKVSTRLINNSKVEICIEDNGGGIPEKVLNQVFDPFFTTKEVGKGTGLGLSISYNIVKDHKGEIIVKSKPGKGSCFTILIPVKQLEEVL